jgi:hypothetical protein
VQLEKDIFVISLGPKFKTFIKLGLVVLIFVKLPKTFTTYSSSLLYSCVKLTGSNSEFVSFCIVPSPQ